MSDPEEGDSAAGGAGKEQDQEVDESGRKLYHGLWRGTVLDNIDPLELNRLSIEIPALPICSPLSFALPCQPYGGPQVGMVLTPPIGAHVWVTFENGDPSFPIWVGCFWLEGEKPLLAELPTQQVFATGTLQAMMNDIPGTAELMVELGPPGIESPVLLTVTTAGVTFTDGIALFTITPEEASAIFESTNIILTNAGLVIEAVANVNVTAPEISTEGNFTQIGAVEIEGNVDVTGAVEVQGNIEIAGAVELQGNVEITGAVEIQGNVDITGALEIQGNANVTGAMEVEGDVAVVGAVEIGGDVAIAAMIEIAGDIALLGAIEVAGAVCSVAYTPGGINTI
jgi:predicted acyltransferase (DUF342 family)